MTVSRCACGAPKSARAERCLKCRDGSKLTKEQQDEIFARVQAGEKTYPLAEEFGVTHQTISNVARKFGLDLSWRKGNHAQPRKPRLCIECRAPVSFYAKRCRSCSSKRTAVTNLKAGRRDITGMRFGKLVAVRPSTTRKNGYVEWFCKCDCGGDKLVALGPLTNGDVRSCGCLIGRGKK